MESNELIVVDTINAIDVFTVKDGIEKILADIESKLSEFTPDTSTATGRKAIASMAYKVSQSKVILDDLGKNLVADWKSKSALVDASRKIARDRLDALRDKTREPLTLWEKAEEERQAAEKLAREIETAHTEALIENDLYNRAKEIAAREAELARIEAERKAAEEAERIEAERIAYEERLRQEAAEKARKEEYERAAAQIAEAERKAREAEESAKKAELEKQLAAEKAESEKRAAIAEAEAKAKREAERLEAERLAEERAKKEREEAEKREAEKKAADIEHRRAINREVMSGLIDVGLTEKQAKAVITAVAGGLINHVFIKY